jgi:hypothetical protein
LKFNSIRCAVVLSFLFASISGLSQSRGPIARFTATTANTSSPGDAVRIDVLRWTTDAEREPLFAALEKGSDSTLLGLLQRAPTIGYIWTTESAGYPLRYAYRVATPEGGERIILAIDKQLGSYEPLRWKLSGTAARTEYPFTVVELRFGKVGLGEGKATLNSKVIADTSAKTIALDNYAATPVLLQGVKK